MAKNFPYFKFIATEWLTGDIVYEDFEQQGLFINICALYWQRDGRLSFDDIIKRYKNELNISLLTPRFFSVTDGFISIKFLDEQLIEAGHISKVNSENGKKGGRPKALKTLEKKPTAKRNESEKKQIKEKKRKEEDKLYQSILPFVSLYGKNMCRDFYDYWSEPNTSETKFRWEMEKTWDIGKRLKRWSDNQTSFKKQTTTKYTGLI